MSLYRTLCATLLLCACPLLVWADEQDKPDPRQRYRTLLREARTHLPNYAGHAVIVYLRAVRVRPDGAEAYMRLSGLWRGKRDFFVREAVRRGLETDAQRRDARLLLGRDARVLKFGRAAKLEAFYVGRVMADATWDGTPSVAVGARVDGSSLVVHGLDGAGDLVPLDVEVLVSGPAFAKRDGGVVAIAPARRATLAVRDRKSGLTAEVALRVVGPPTRLSIRQGAKTVKPGEQLHFNATFTDAAGNRVWCDRMVWTAAHGERDLTRELLPRVYSRLDHREAGETHVMTLMPPAGSKGYRGPVAVTAVEPESGLSQKLTVTVGSDADGVVYDKGRVPWGTDLAAARARAAETGKPLMVYFYGRW